MSVETDDHGRLYLPAELRERYGERFHVVEYEDRIELVPVADDPLAAVRDAAGDAFDDVAVAEVRALVDEAAESAARADRDRSER